MLVLILALFHLSFCFIIPEITFFPLFDTPKPVGYANSFFAIHSSNKTLPKIGKQFPLEAHTRWYDYTKKALKDACSVNDVTSTVLFRVGKIYITNAVAEKCLVLNFTTPLINPKWMADGKYIGKQLVNDVLSFHWQKMDHDYFEAVHDRRLVRVFAPFDQNGRTVQDDYIIYQPQEIDESIFNVPEYCQENGNMEPADEKENLFPCFFFKQEFTFTF